MSRTKSKKTAPAVDPLADLYTEWRAAVGNRVDEDELNETESALRELPRNEQVAHLQHALQRLSGRRF
jgi:hypothetical protein